ncbi:GM20873 [Drosophila sechellia]|uniref:GM20873 n=1 Tax=Drosophila sechellia TaxID=7238 RepID=B4HPU9_DROSE|nr:GM20873 [Drosophila sechellia]
MSSGALNTLAIVLLLMPGAYVHQWVVPEEEYNSGLKGYVETFCCLYSPSNGCQLALNPGIFNKEKLPVTRCRDCIKHCQCSNKAGTPLKPRMIVSLLGMFAMLTESIYLTQKVWAGCALGSGKGLEPRVARRHGHNAIVIVVMEKSSPPPQE